MTRQILIIFAFFLLLCQTSQAQVDLYLFHPEWKSFQLGNIQNIYLYNHSGVSIDGIIDVQIYDQEEKLIYHIRTANATYPSGKSLLNAYFRVQEVLTDQITNKSLPLSNHLVEVQIIHPLDNRSVIASYVLDTKKCGPENGYQAGRERNFYITPYSFEAFSRESDFAKEGI